MTAPRSTIRGLLRVCATIAYFVCWATVMAVLSLVLGAVAWEALDANRVEGLAVDDDVTLAALPIGAALGLWAARRTLRSRRVHDLCRPVGWVVFGGALTVAYFYALEARSLSGTGMLAGVGETLAALVFVGLAVVGLLILAIAATGATVRWAGRDPGEQQAGAPLPVDGSRGSV